MDGRKVNQGLVGFQRDLQRLSTNFNRITIKNLRLIALNVSKAYAKRYNSIMRGEGHNSLAKARVSTKRSTNKQVSVNIIVPTKSVSYDLMKPHYVDVRRPSVRAWVRKKWNYINRVGWRATQSWAGKSMVKTGRNKAPTGTLFVLSHKDKYGWSVGERSNDVVLSTLTNELSEFANKRFKSDVRNFLKSNYLETFNFNLSAKAK